MNLRILSYAIVSALGGLLFGFDTAVINGALPFFREYFELSNTMEGWAVSAALIGCIPGALFIGHFADRAGRRDMLKILAIFFIISAVGSGMAQSVSSFIVFRFIGGVAVGGASVLSPMYITEIAPASFRGRLTITFQVAIVTGILVAFFSDYLLLNSGINNWRWMFVSEVVPALAFFVLLFFVSRSPRWLVKKGFEQKAADTLELLHKDENTGQLLNEIKASLKPDKERKKENLLSKKNIKLLMIGISVAFFNQMTGINIVMYYATDIFQTAGFSTESSIGQTVIIGATNLFFTIVALMVIDRIGRKKMLLTGSFGMSFFLAWFGYAYLQGISGDIMLIALVGFIAFFAFSQGAVIWVLLSEMYPNSIRARATSASSFALWLFNGLIAFLFPVIKGLFGDGSGVGYIFLGCAIITFLSFFVFRRYLLETKGRSLEQLERETKI